MGLWLAGLMDLAYVEVGIAMLLTVTLMEKKTGATKSQQRFCAGLMLCWMYRQCFVFGVDVSYENYVELHHFFPTPTIIKGI